MRNVNLHHLVQSKRKIGERQVVLKRNWTYYVDLNKVNKLLTYSIMIDSVHCSICTIRDIADRIKESAKSRTKVFM